VTNADEEKPYVIFTIIFHETEKGGRCVTVLAISVCPSVSQLYKFEKCIAIEFVWLIFYMNKEK
jgi:hypothetical protein